MFRIWRRLIMVIVAVFPILLLARAVSDLA